jgi:UDP-N-acetylmuramyl pentapeptide synthase
LTRHILFVCSRNRLRSPTAEQVFADWPGVETASAGLSPDATHTASDREVALRGLQHILRDDDVVLLKASNGERFFDLVDELLALAQPESVA